MGIFQSRTHKSNKNLLNLPNDNDILAIVKKEGKVRLSKEYIKECDDVYDEVNGWLRVTGEMQERLVEEQGFPKGSFSFAMALNMLRRAQYLYPKHSAVKRLVYVKNNKANEGNLRPGNTPPNIQLFTIDGLTKLNLSDIFHPTKINIMFEASHT